MFLRSPNTVVLFNDQSLSMSNRCADQLRWFTAHLHEVTNQPRRQVQAALRGPSIHAGPFGRTYLPARSPDRAPSAIRA